jgi:hypothetical protein
MDEAADRTRTAEPPPASAEPHAPSNEPHAPSDERIREEKQHEEAEGIAVEGDDLSEILGAALGSGRPHVGPAEPKGPWAWPPRIGHESEQASPGSPDAADQHPAHKQDPADNQDPAGEPDPADELGFTDEADENQCG